MSRTLAREDAFKLVYEMELTGVSPSEALEYLFETVDTANEMWAQSFVSKANRKYIEEAVNGIDKERENLNMLIEPKLKGWTIKRLSRVSLAILQLAIYEIKFMSDIPDKVSVNEAVEIAKKYGGSEAGSFVNGVLGAILKEGN